MKSCIRICPFVLIITVLTPSCALQDQFALRFHKHKPSHTEEASKALTVGNDFQPHHLTSYFFLVDASRGAPPFLATAAPPYASVAGEQLPGVRTTAYCHDEADHIKYGHLNAVGTFLKYGAVRSAAADWSRYPLGTRFRIASEPGVIYEVDDYGRALVGTGTIDLYRPTQQQMNSWGVRNVDIEVVQWGSFERSRQYLQGRTRYPHVRQMFFDIERRLNGQPPASTSITPITAMIEPTTVTTPGLSPST